MLITTDNEIKSLMPTARWDRPEELYGYLDEEESGALVPLLGHTLYQHIINEYERLHGVYGDITSTTIRPTRKAKADAQLAHADVTERVELIRSGDYRSTFVTPEPGVKDVSEEDMQTIKLINICQQIEFYRMIAHKSGLLTVSFNGGGGMNIVNAEGYDPAEEKRLDRVVKDAFMSAGRSTDSLLLFLEADAKGDKFFTEKWQEADTFYLHKDLLFQTARVLNEYLDIKGERMAYVSLVRDIRYCQNTYLKPRIGAKLLKAVVDFANEGITENGSNHTSDINSQQAPVYDELLSQLRTALGFYVESRRTSLEPAREKLARRDSMTDAQQAMAAACSYIEEHIDELGKAAEGTPIYTDVHARREQEQRAKESAAAREQQRNKDRRMHERKMFTAFPYTHRTPELK